MVFVLGFSFSFSQSLPTDNTIVSKAYKERKKKLMELINWWKLNANLNLLQEKFDNLISEINLDKKVKNKIWDDIQKLKQEINILSQQISEFNNKNIEKLKNLNEKIKKEVEEKKKILSEKQKLLQEKENIIKQLNKTIEENNINKEKIKVLLKDLKKEKKKNDLSKKHTFDKKLMLFIVFTLITITIYHFLNYFNRKWKIDNKKLIYFRFFLFFFYIVFLIWFFFYLYPQLSVFLIFISGYLLIINAHLIASFIWSIVLLYKFKVWDIIRFKDVRWKIVNITPLHIVILPLTDEGIFRYKPMFIPNINALKENILKDENPEFFIHRFSVPIKEPYGIEIMKFVEEVETNILSKFLHIRLDSLEWNNTTYRTYFTPNGVWDIVVNFVWKATDLTSKKIERKIMWLYDQYLGRNRWNEK